MNGSARASSSARGFRAPVAIKRLLSAKAGDLASERLIEEAKLLGLQHGNVVSVLDLVCEGDDVFVVMEYVDGRACGRSGCGSASRPT